MSINYFKSGAYNVICDVCGRKFKNFELRKRWDGFMVCEADFEYRHIADFFKLKPEVNRVRDARHEADDQFVSVTYTSTGDTPYCTVTGRSSVPTLGQPGCMVPGRTFNGGL